MNRYKPVGWRGESHRHYLAAKGISTKSSDIKNTSYFAKISPKRARDMEATSDYVFSKDDGFSANLVWDGEEFYLMHGRGNAQEVQKIVAFDGADGDLLLYAVTKEPKNSMFGEGYMEGYAFNLTEPRFSESGSMIIPKGKETYDVNTPEDIDRVRRII